MEQGEAAGPGVGGTEYGALAPRQRSVQVLAAADLDQFRQGPGPAPQPHQIDDKAGGPPEVLPGQALSLFRAEFVTEHPAQVTDNLGALPAHGTGNSNPPASRRHGRRGWRAAAPASGATTSQ